MGENRVKSLKVSIIMPTYNRAKLLERCISSVLPQTYTNWELIIADDGSPDNTQDEANRLMRLDSRIIYHRNNKNLGLPKNRNIAIQLATGDLIFFIEDDIILEPDCLDILVKTMEELKQKNLKVGAICPALVAEVSESGKQRGILNFVRKEREKDMEKSPCIIDKKTGLIYRNFSPYFNGLYEIEDCHACSLYSKQIFDELRYEERAYQGNYAGEESELHMKMGRMGYKMYFQPIAVIYHKTVSSGGCRIPFHRWSYYYIRNHIVFITRNFGIARALYMVPCFGFFNLFMIFKYIVRG